MIAAKTYFKPVSPEEAMKIASENNGNFKYLAGGTDVIVNKFQGNENSGCLIDLTEIKSMREVTTDSEEIKVGSLVTLDELQFVEMLNIHYPTLIDAAHQAASPMLRKTATIGGNILCENRCSFYNQSEWWKTAVGYCLKCDGDICIATGGRKSCFSKFVSDTAPVLIASEAQLEIMDLDGIKRVPLESIYTGDGIQPRNISNTAIILHIILPLKKEYRMVFKKLRLREAVDFTSLTTVVSKDRVGNIAIVLGGVDPKPVVVRGNVNDEPGALTMQATKKARVIDNDVFSRKYRKEMIGVFLRQSFNELN